MRKPETGLVVAGRFRLQRELGRGGMGTVWVAHHIVLDAPCAVKFMETASNELARERFQREARAAARLRGSHVVQILDYGVWEETPYIAMELLRGEDLRQRLRRQGKLSAAGCVEVMVQVARALRRAHGEGVIHRDLKPDNIFLCKEGSQETVKVLDFGVAKILEADGSSGLSTVAGTMVGTPYYMSPEQLTGAPGGVGFASDLWSLGVVVFECMTGRLPFAGQSMGELMMLVKTSPLPVPSRLDPALPRSFDDWWARAARRDPSERFASPREMVEALAAALGVRLSQAQRSLLSDEREEEAPRAPTLASESYRPAGEAHQAPRIIRDAPRAAASGEAPRPAPSGETLHLTTAAVSGGALHLATSAASGGPLHLTTAAASGAAPRLATTVAASEAPRAAAGEAGEAPAAAGEPGQLPRRLALGASALLVLVALASAVALLGGDEPGSSGVTVSLPEPAVYVPGLSVPLVGGAAPSLSGRPRPGAPAVPLPRLPGKP